MLTYTVTTSNSRFSDLVRLDGSKSLSNRCLLIRTLSGGKDSIAHLSTSNDTRTLEHLLEKMDQQAASGWQEIIELDAGAAGTTFRFMTALTAISPGVQVLTGSQRMLQRPIGVLVDALRQLGSTIQYLGKEGYPPLKIGPFTGEGTTRLEIPAHTSSQYISALLMIAPKLPNGLTLVLTGGVVSRPYIEMTLRLMQHLGVVVQSGEDDRSFRVEPQEYNWQPITVEADWSAASYYYAMAALNRGSEIELHGLTNQRWQGDAVLAEMMETFGVTTKFTGEGIVIHSSTTVPTQPFSYDFLECPDLAQTLAVVCGGLGVPGRLTGLRTLRIKETDRIEALRMELKKVGVTVTPGKSGDEEWIEIEGKAAWSEPPVFATYEDHRMAMAFAPLALLGAIQISDPQVVAKSYPAFWEDITRLGFNVERTGV
jgi:3-phosphoshikimate 1-carboxyvinyltransferase